MKQVPYYTADDESVPYGHIYRGRDQISGRWGFAWEVYEPYDDTPCAGGWRLTQEEAEAAMNEKLSK